MFRFQTRKKDKATGPKTKPNSHKNIWENPKNWSKSGSQRLERKKKKAEGIYVIWAISLPPVWTLAV